MTYVEGADRRKKKDAAMALDAPSPRLLIIKFVITLYGIARLFSVLPSDRAPISEFLPL